MPISRVHGAIDVEAPRPAGGRLTLHPRPGNSMVDSLIEEYGQGVGGDDPAKRAKAMLDLIAAHKRGEADPALTAFWIATREFRVAGNGHTTVTARPGMPMEAYRKLTTEVTPAGGVTVSGPVPGGEMELLGEFARDTLTWSDGAPDRRPRLQHRRRARPVCPGHPIALARR